MQRLRLLRRTAAQTREAADEAWLVAQPTIADQPAAQPAAAQPAELAAQPAAEPAAQPSTAAAAAAASASAEPVVEAEVVVVECSPTGAREQLVLFNHGQVDGEEDQEVRAVILESSYGRGLYYASAASRGREYSFYDGMQVTREEYVELDEFTGLRHTLEVGGGGRVVSGLRGGTLINGLHGVTGMQYANTSRGGAEANNADFAGTATVRVSAPGGVVRGQPVLLPYEWSAATWEEIGSGVVGVCAYEERGRGQGMGEGGGTFVVELATALRKGGLATQLLREARVGWGKGQGRTELQVHMARQTNPVFISSAFLLPAFSIAISTTYSTSFFVFTV